MLPSISQWVVSYLTLSVAFLLAKPASWNLDLLAPPPPPGGEPARVLLLTAHPDDECMFFAPTVLALLAQAPPPAVYSLCLSVGNADGLGETRREELGRSLDVLGVGTDRRWVVDRPDLQDNFTATWDADVIAEVLRPYVAKNRITTILTFDHNGISSHPNHISLPHGAAHMLSSSASQHQSEPKPRLFTLVTVPLAAKYTGLLAPLKYRSPIAIFFGSSTTPKAEDPREAIAVSSWTGYARAHRAMRQHRSQLVWFRWLYVAFSRYMWVNEWVELYPASVARTASEAGP